MDIIIVWLGATEQEGVGIIALDEVMNRVSKSDYLIT